MNWILTGVFYICIMLYYYFLADMVFSFLKIKKSGLAKILYGFIFVTFLCFLVGVPFQLFRANWYLYATVLSLVHLIIIVCMARYHLPVIKKTIRNLLKNRKLIVLDHFKHYWVVYLLIACFCILSFTNLLAYYQQNYDDTYYIAKVVQSIGAVNIGGENAFNGSQIDTIGGGIIRVFNTYELTYSYFGTLSGIDIPFFCRVTMTIHNYFIVFATYILLARKFLKKELSQYALVPFFLFLITAGYLAEHNLPIIGVIRSYDLWQFQTAMFYGGSLVRSMALPLLILLVLPLIEKVTLKRVSILIISCCSMLSFSTIFIQQAMLVILIAIFIKCIYQLRNFNRNYTLLSIFGISFVAIMVLILAYINRYMCINDNMYVDGMANFVAFYNYYIKVDFIMKYGLILIVLSIPLFRNMKFSLFASIIFILYLVMTIPIFRSVLSITSFSYFFVSLRSIASLQYIIVFLAGLVAIKTISYIKHSYLISLVLILGCSSFILYYIHNRYQSVISYTYLGSGITSYGYSTEVVLNNDKMMPDVFVEIGEYFNKLKYDNYRLYAPAVMNYDGKELQTAGLAFASNRIETCTYGGCDNITFDEEHILNNFTNTDDVTTVLKNRSIKYILVEEESYMNSLVQEGGILCKVITSKLGDDFYLLKAPE